MATPTPTFGHIKVFELRDKSVDSERRIVRGLASTPTLDRQNEIVEPTAFTGTLESYLRNPVVTWSHDLRELPIGRTRQAEVRPEGLYVEIEFGTHTRANEVWQAVQDELVRSLSIGFDGEYTPEFGYWDKGAEAWRWTRVDLWEIAVCSVPACPDATFSLGKSLGLHDPPSRQVLEGVGQEQLTGVDVGEPPDPEPVADAPEPATTSDHPSADETDQTAKQMDRVESDLKRLDGASQGLANITRHWAKTGGAPSARVVSAAASSIAVLAGVCKGGRVLSARNREAVETALSAVTDARTALEEVLARDDESQSSRASADADAADKTAPVAPDAEVPNPPPAPRTGVRIIAPTATPASQTTIRIRG